MNNENETDWLKFYNELNIEKELKERSERAKANGGITATIRQYTTDTINGWQHKKFIVLDDADRIVGYAIFDLKYDTMLLSKPALLEFLKEEKVRGIKRPDFIQQTYLTKQIFFEANVIYKTFLTQLENSLQAKPKPEAKALLNLEAIFADKTKTKLKKLVKLLKEKNFAEEEAGRLYWIKKPVEFAAMAKTCLPLIKKEHQEPKILHHAWTSMFLHKEKTPKDILTIQYFKTKAKENEIAFHLEKFEFIKFEFDIE